MRWLRGLFRERSHGQADPPKPASSSIEALPYLREGISFRFHGAEPDSDGNPVGQFIDIELIVPPLNFNSLRQMQQRLQRFGTEGTSNGESMETLCDALMHALRRNYRNVPRWLIEQSIDIANMPEMMLALMDVSGLRRKGIEQGKAKAAEASIGTSSTAP